MRIRKRGKRLVFLREITEILDDGEQFLANERKGFLHHDHVGIVADVAGGRTEVNDRARIRAKIAVRVNVSHNVVAELLFVSARYSVVDIVDMRFEFSDLRVRDVEAHCLFCFRKRDPKLSPGGEFHIGGEKILHFGAGISAGKCAFITVGCHVYLPFHFLYLKCFKLIVRKVFPQQRASRRDKRSALPLPRP